MYLFSNQGVPWPPIGWKHFSSIKKSCGQALNKDPKTATIVGLSYKIEANPVRLDSENLSYVYSVVVDGWAYSIQNDSQEYPIMSFNLLSRPEDAGQKLPYLSNLRIMGDVFSLNESKAHRAIMAALFFIKQIDREHAPDYERVLKLYRLDVVHAHRNLITAEKKSASVYEADLELYKDN